MKTVAICIAIAVTLWFVVADGQELAWRILNGMHTR